MKPIYKWILFVVLFLNTFACFIAFIGITLAGETSGSVTFGIMFLVFGILTYRTKKIKTSNSPAKVQTQKYKQGSTVESSNKFMATNQRTAEISEPNFELSQITGSSIQLLESLDIINETKSIDTLSGRIKFVNSIFGSFINLRAAPQYERQAQIGIDRYKELYYNKTLKDFHFSILMNPNLTDLEKFYGNAIYESYKRFVESHEVQIQSLKRAPAILKRKEDIINTGYTAKQIFKDFEIPDYLNNLERIEDIRKKYYNYQKSEL